MDPNKAEQTGLSKDTPLHTAAHKGNVEVMRLLITAGGDPNKRRRDGSTPLHKAAQKGNVEVLQLLLEAGGDPNLAEPHLGTPMHLVAEKGSVEATRLLLAAGGDPNNSRRDGGWTPVHICALMGNAEVLLLLLAAGGNVEVYSSWSIRDGWKTWSFIPGLRCRADREYWLLKKQTGCTPLHTAAHRGRVKVLRLLLDSWASTAGRFNGNTAQEMAAHNNHADAVRMLEEHEPRAAAMALVACRQRLALAACFYPGTGGAQFTLPEDVVVRIVELRHNLFMPLWARYELTRAPRMAVVCSPAPCMPHLHPARTPG